MVKMLNLNNSVNEMSINNNPTSSITFDQALKDKYVNQQDLDDRVVLNKDEKISTDITFVGFGKLLSVQKTLIKLINIDLSNKNISSAGCFDDLHGGLNRVRVLNLADNRLSWNEVARIINHIPRLNELILNNNPLYNQNVDNSVKPQRSLALITLGHIHSDWNTIVKQLSKSVISVKRIDLWSNQLDCDKMVLGSSEFDNFIQGIQALRLTHNYFQNLDWLKSVGPVYNLIELDVSNCGIQKINLDKETMDILGNLRDLNISYNELDQWTSISCLHHLKSLRHVICHENPIFITDKDSKATVIAFLGQIVTVNREEISKTKRTDSEVFYIRKTFPQYKLHQDGRSNEFIKQHPRYEELINIYGIPEDLNRKVQVDKFVTVDLCFEGRKLTKKLPRDMKVAKVEIFCKKLFNIKPFNSVVLTCRDIKPNRAEIVYKLDNDGMTLHFFSVEDGHELHVELI